ncbi:porin family protein [Vibrio sp. YMD68]|uniref:porin family protein n=1 Tax=Vibrio sp. YMD68 TaxID=3042300 RepID=UPI00249C4410|nr:porin family protein [Vibrio sp. YMD68]WGW01365.1 porin family protein [Vibrio sp. YMD68]
MQYKAFIYAFFLLSFSAYSFASHQYFVGAGVGYHDVSFQSINLYDSANGSALHIRAGLDINENHRTNLTGNVTKKELNNSSHSTTSNIKLNQIEWLASYDYLFPINQTFSLFGGVSIGFINNEFNHHFDSYEEYDFAFGGQFGSQYKINQIWSIDGTYRYMGKSYDYSYLGVSEKINNHSELAVSLDFRF